MWTDWVNWMNSVGCVVLLRLRMWTSSVWTAICRGIMTRDTPSSSVFSSTLSLMTGSENTRSPSSRASTEQTPCPAYTAWAFRLFLYFFFTQHWQLCEEVNLTCLSSCRIHPWCSQRSIKRRSCRTTTTCSTRRGRSLWLENWSGTLPTSWRLKVGNDRSLFLCSEQVYLEHIAHIN